MNDKKILENFVDLSNESVKKWVNFLQESLSFTAKEKAFFFIDASKYSVQQIEQFTKSLEKEKLANEKLAKEYPEEFAKRKERCQEAWRFMLERLEEYIVSRKISE